MGNFGRCFVSALMLSVLFGCFNFGSSKRQTAAVSGQVTYEGQPVTEGQVIFVPTGEGYAVSADLQSDGSYSVRSQDGGLPSGSYQVSVVPPVIKLANTQTSPGDEVLKEVDNIPSKYRSVTASGLQLTVDTKAVTFNISMSK